MSYFMVMSVYVFIYFVTGCVNCVDDMILSMLFTYM